MENWKFYDAKRWLEAGAGVEMEWSGMKRMLRGGQGKIMIRFLSVKVSYITVMNKVNKKGSLCSSSWREKVVKAKKKEKKILHTFRGLIVEKLIKPIILVLVTFFVRR